MKVSTANYHLKENIKVHEKLSYKLGNAVRHWQQHKIRHDIKTQKSSTKRLEGLMIFKENFLLLIWFNLKVLKIRI